MIHDLYRGRSLGAPTCSAWASESLSLAQVDAARIRITAIESSDEDEPAE